MRWHAADLVLILCNAKVAVMVYQEICYNYNQGSKPALQNACIGKEIQGTAHYISLCDELDLFILSVSYNKAALYSIQNLC